VYGGTRMIINIIIIILRLLLLFSVVNFQY